QSADIVHKALDLGVNLFDTADVYGERGKSERYLGEALGARRREVVIATKFAGPMSSERSDLQGGSRRYIMHAVEASLTRLGTDYIDLYQMHRFDEDTPIEETLRALDDLVRDGKVRYVGCSNYAAWQIADAAWTARASNLNGYVSAQNRYSLLTRDIETQVVPACEKFGLGILPYFPLESGLLTGKYRKGEAPPEGTRLAQWGSFGAGAFASDDKFDKVVALQSLCERHDHSLLDMAMGWLASRPHVSSVIAGVTTVAQLEQNVSAGAWRPGEEELAEIDEITAPPVEGFGPPRR
ncbi:MAG: aldo/keto reductase, partial [Gammaproteobacteria bacterium]